METMKKTRSNIWTRIKIFLRGSKDFEDRITNVEKRIRNAEEKIKDIEAKAYIGEMISKTSIEEDGLETKMKVVWNRCFKQKIIVFFIVLAILYYIIYKIIEAHNLENIESVDYIAILKNTYVISAIVTLFLISLICLVFNYLRKDAVDKHKTLFGKVGYDITHVFSWIFSANGLLFLIGGVTISFVVFIMTKWNNLTTGGGSDKVQLTAFTLTISLSALIPSLIAKIVAKNQLNDIIDDKLEKELDKFKTSLYNIRKDKGHSCRMSAALLLQNAEILKGEEKIKNATWSIGWASEAIIQYLLIKDKYPHALKRIEECGKYIYRANNILSTSPRISSIKSEYMISILTMYALNKLFCFGDTIGNANINQIAKDFYNYRDKNKDFTSSSCRITGMGDEFNKKLESEVDTIISSFEKK